MDSASWDKAEDFLKKAETSSALLLLLRMVRTLDTDVEGGFTRVDGRLADLEKGLDRESVAVRMHALELARAHISALPSEQPNARGYRDKALTPEERVAEELRVARYLLERT